MAVAGIIGAAVGVILLIVVAYIVVGSTLTAAETVSNAQKDLTLQNEMRIRTAFTITDPKNTSSIITSNVSNTGTQIISDFKHMDVIVYDTGSNDYQVCTYDSSGSNTSGT
jgi:flagellar protein FlaF